MKKLAVLLVFYSLRLRKTFDMKPIYLLAISLIISANITGQNLNTADIMVVIDNSASMKKNDPDFLLKEAIFKFTENVRENAKTGFIRFSTNVDVFRSLQQINTDSAKNSFRKIVGQIDYSGRFTNIPAAVEKAFYELKTNGQKDIDRIILIMTDGIVDLEDPTLNDEKEKWLKEIITEDCKKENIRIFSIAFTESADFELLQTISLKTGGSYFRALTAGDISGVFNSISEELMKGEEQVIKETEPVIQTDSVVSDNKDSEKDISTGVIIIISLIFVMAVTGMLIYFSKKRHILNELPAEELPEAYLIDVSGITNKGTYQIKKRITRIGRAEANDLYIPDEKNFISSYHAIIEYSNQNFYVIDQDSVNGTSVNGTRVEKKEKVHLKGGDQISFDKYSFKFLCPVEGERGQTVLNINESIGTMTVKELPDESGDSNNSNTAG